MKRSFAKQNRCFFGGGAIVESVVGPLNKRAEVRIKKRKPDDVNLHRVLYMCLHHVSPLLQPSFTTRARLPLI